MSAAKSVLLVLCFSICATAQTRTLVVYPGPADGLSSVSSHYLEVELKRILSPAGIVPVWRNSGERTGKRLEAGPLVVASFKGACGVESLPAYAAPAQTRALADTSVSGAGRTFTVRLRAARSKGSCSIRRSMRPVLFVTELPTPRSAVTPPHTR